VKMPNAWKKVMSNVMLSARYGAAGARTTTILKQAGLTQDEVMERITNNYSGNKKVNIDHVYLEQLFQEQNGRCYYLNTIIDPQNVFVSNHPLAPSVDRLDNNYGYVKGNVVIATRFANRGKECADYTWFIEECVPEIIHGLLNNDELPNLEEFAYAE
jgi:hypothetical protein